MSVLTVGQGLLRGRWMGVLSSILSVGVLAIVPALALTRLAGESFVFERARDGSAAFLSLAEGLTGLLAFEAPSSTVAGHEVAVTKETRRSGKVGSGPEAVTELTDWEFTDSSLQEQCMAIVNLQFGELLFDAFLLQNGATANGLIPTLYFQLTFNDALLSQLGPVSSDLVSMFNQQLFFDLFLFGPLYFQGRLTPEQLFQVLELQLALDFLATQAFCNSLPASASM